MYIFSELSEILTTAKAIRLILLEMLILSELTEKSEEHMQAFNSWLIIRKLMAWNVDHWAY